MTRDYIDFMNMTAQELAQYARDETKTNPCVLPSSVPLINALADMISALVEENDELSTAAVDLKIDLKDAERRADGWREEAQAVQRQLDMVRG